jgi:hypothetical protein
MFGLGAPEVFIIFIISLFAYSVLMLIDAVRRPASQYKFGSKNIWIVLFVIFNPLITKYFGVQISSICLLLLFVTSTVYHVKNRWNNPISK